MKTFKIDLSGLKSNVILEGTGVAFENGGSLSIWKDGVLVKAFAPGTWVSVSQIA